MYTPSEKNKKETVDRREGTSLPPEMIRVFVSGINVGTWFVLSVIVSFRKRCFAATPKRETGPKEKKRHNCHQCTHPPSFFYPHLWLHPPLNFSSVTIPLFSTEGPSILPFLSLRIYFEISIYHFPRPSTAFLTPSVSLSLPSPSLAVAAQRTGHNSTRYFYIDFLKVHYSARKTTPSKKNKKKRSR